MTALLALLIGSGQAATVGACATVDGGAVPLAAVQAIAWHALYDAHGHDAHVVDCDRPDLASHLAERHLATLVRTDVTWQAQALAHDGGVFLTEAPLVTVTELRVADGALHTFRSWAGMGAPVLADHDGEAVVLPEAALQAAMGRTLGEATPPAWRPVPADRLSVPVHVVADEEYRARYGDRWAAHAAQRVARAGALLAPSGLDLHVAATGEWSSPDDAADLGALLRALSADAPPAGVLRVAFTAQPGPVDRGTAEDVGRAWMPGHDVLLVDQSTPSGAAWDVADEAVAATHEILHALGVPHVRQPWFVMSEVKTGTVAVLSPSTQALARAAAQARWAHWDSAVALTALCQVADQRLRDLDLQVDFVVDNLGAGPGMPEPGSLAPGALSPLANVAMGRHLLDRARREPERAAALREHALAHSLAAARVRPAQARALLVELVDRPSEDAPSLAACTEDWGPWVVGECADFDR